MGCFLDDLGAFGINADQWTTAVERGGIALDGGTFHGEMNHFRKRQGWTTACSSMPRRDWRGQGEDNPNQAGSCWFARAIVD